MMAFTSFCNNTLTPPAVMLIIGANHYTHMPCRLRFQSEWKNVWTRLQLLCIAQKQTNKTTQQQRIRDTEYNTFRIWTENEMWFWTEVKKKKKKQKKLRKMQLWDDKYVTRQIKQYLFRHNVMQEALTKQQHKHQSTDAVYTSQHKLCKWLVLHKETV